MSLVCSHKTFAITQPSDGYNGVPDSCKEYYYHPSCGASKPCHGPSANECKPFPGTPATTYGGYWTGGTVYTNVTKHCCAAVEQTLPPSQPAKVGATVSVAATTEDAYPIMYLLACVSTQSAGQLRATEGHQHD
jgi:hypothetical protein